MAPTLTSRNAQHNDNAYLPFLTLGLPTLFVAGRGFAYMYKLAGSLG
jgi:hypothetical protein